MKSIVNGPKSTVNRRGRFRPSPVAHRLSPIACLLLIVISGSPAFAAVDDFLGKNIVEVHLRSNDVEMRDPFLAEVVETKFGRPLTMAAVVL